MNCIKQSGSFGCIVLTLLSKCIKLATVETAKGRATMGLGIDTLIANILICFKFYAFCQGGRWVLTRKAPGLPHPTESTYTSRGYDRRRQKT